MAYIPSGYLSDFLGFLNARRDAIEVLTYADLDWSDDWDYANGYPAEWRAWNEALRSGKRDRRKAYLLLQHDVDSVPERTVEAVRAEERCGVRSSIMVFNRRVDRRYYQDTGELRYTPYIDDPAFLKNAEAQGFVVGYHCNAFERAGFDRQRAEQIMAEDIEELNRHYSIAFMSAHGGPRSPDGRSNNSLDLPDALRRRVRWVHNGYGIKVDGAYSDGGMNSGRRQPEEFDLRRFIGALQPGKRYRVLLHPQYYTAEVEANPKLRAPWYDEVLDAYAGRSRNVWAGVELGSHPPTTAGGGWNRRIKGLWGRLSGR